VTYQGNRSLALRSRRSLTAPTANSPVLEAARW
jgi:hypothetical protein